MNPVTSPLGYSYSGTPGAVPLPYPGVRYTPGTGRVLTNRWQGTPEEIEALEAALIADGVPYRISPGQEGGYRTIDIDEPTPERADFQLFQTDDLIGSDPEKSLLQHESLEEAAAPAAAVATLRTCFSQYDSQTFTREVLLATLALEEALYSLPSGTLSDLFSLHASGVRGFFESVWIIRRTSIFAPRATVQTVSNVRKVFETSVDLETMESIDPNRIWEIPAGQWLKKTPQFIRQRNGGQTVFTVEWWRAKQWSATLYERAA